jgi:hypothetical protein
MLTLRVVPYAKLRASNQYDVYLERGKYWPTDYELANICDGGDIHNGAVSTMQEPDPATGQQHKFVTVHRR